ncbi:MAG: hypothetical protein ACRC3Y_09110 [Romboutsia sp.]|uniref:hypothetical protein n=1 Tax=Romboutsia sp. TaxID=1965302 RepID=UPI003F356FB0
MLNINVLYIYPKIMEINNEINLFRIVDNNIKETLVIYGEKQITNYKILMINTMSGEINTICEINESEIESFIENIKVKDIISQKDLNSMEKYILNLTIY